MTEIVNFKRGYDTVFSNTSKLFPIVKQSELDMKTFDSDEVLSLAFEKIETDLL